jgi:hypothetical protein
MVTVALSACCSLPMVTLTLSVACCSCCPPRWTSSLISSGLGTFWFVVCIVPMATTALSVMLVDGHSDTVDSSCCCCCGWPPWHCPLPVHCQCTDGHIDTVGCLLMPWTSNLISWLAQFPLSMVTLTLSINSSYASISKIHFCGPAGIDRSLISVLLSTSESRRLPRWIAPLCKYHSGNASSSSSYTHTIHSCTL